jgi:hypothetical protein
MRRPIKTYGRVVLGAYILVNIVVVHFLIHLVSMSVQNVGGPGGI